MNKKPKVFRSLEEYVDYRNKIVTRAISRTEKFQDERNNYYWKRLRDMDDAYPQFRAIGKITIKKG